MSGRMFQLSSVRVPFFNDGSAFICVNQHVDGNILEFCRVVFKGYTGDPGDQDYYHRRIEQAKLQAKQIADALEQVLGPKA